MNSNNDYFSQKPYKRVLKNGMTVFALPKDKEPKVLVQVAYNVGSAAEEHGEKGLAHLVEHMIFKGTKKMSEGDIDAISRRYGASFNAFTSQDVTSYYFECAKNFWPHFLDVLSDCMSNVKFDPQHLASEVRAVIQELNMYRDSHSSSMIQSAFKTHFKDNHPYHCPIIGFKEDLAALTSERLRAFYEKHYSPDRAVLFIIGDIDPEDALNRASAVFEGLLAQPSRPQLFFPEPVDEISSSVVTLYEDVQLPLVAYTWLIPGLDVCSPEVFKVLSEILGGGESGLLHTLLVDQEQVADSVSIGDLQLARSGIFYIFFEPKIGCEAQCFKLITDTLESIVTQGISQQIWDKAIVNEKVKLAHLSQSSKELVYEWLTSYFATGSEAQFFNGYSLLENLTQEAVIHIVSTYLGQAQMNTTAVYPLDDKRKKMWELLNENSKQLEQSILQIHQRTVPIEEPRYVHTMPKPELCSYVPNWQPEEVTFSNGFRVIFAQKSLEPFCGIELRFKGGEKLTSSLQGQLLNFVMMMLIEGSEGFSKEQNVSALESCGVTYWYNQYGMFANILGQYVVQTVPRLFHILLNPTFEVTAFEKVKKNLINQLERAYQESGASIASRIFMSTLYSNTDNCWTLAQAIQAFSSLTVDDARKFHQKFVSPDNMVAAVVGNFDSEFIKTYFSKLSAEWLPSNQKSGLFDLGERIILDSPRVLHHSLMNDQVTVMLGKQSSVRLLDTEFIPLRLANYIMFHSLGSRLYALRERTGLFYTASGTFLQGLNRDQGGHCYAYSIVNPGNVNAFIDGVLQMFIDVEKSGFLPSELDDACQLEWSSIVKSYQTVSSIASAYLTYALLDLPVTIPLEWLDFAKKITPEQLQMIVSNEAKNFNQVCVTVGKTSE